MATCSSIVNRALRKIGRLGAGRDARTNDAQDALDVLRGMYTAWITSGAFGRLTDVIAKGGDITAYENQRVIRPIGVEAEVKLPDFVPRYEGRCLPYGALWPLTLDNAQRDGRPPRENSVIVVVDQDTGTIQNWIYDGSLKRWVQIDELGLVDTAPLSSADPEGLAACLAIQVSDQFGGEPTQATVMAAQRFRQSITHRYSSPRVEAVGVYV